MIELSARPIAPDVLEVLSKASAEGNLLYLNADKLDRKLYTDTNKVLDAMGGKWKGGKVAAHVFEEGTDVAGLLEIVLEHGKSPEKNPLAFFRSTPIAIEFIRPYMPTGFAFGLDPSCGDGALLQLLYECSPGATIKGVEIDKKRAAVAASLGIAQVYGEEDFLSWGEVDHHPFDAIAMNPPFSIKGNPTVYVDHIELAYSLLASEGRLLAIAPSGLTTSTVGRVAELRELVEHQGLFLDLPENSFQESGTGVSTVLVIIDKPRP